MAKSNSKTSVFRGRKDALKALSVEERLHKSYAKYDHVPSSTKAAHNVGKRTKTQRKELARVTRNLKNVGLQAKLVKEHIGAGLIFNLLSRCEPKVAP